MPARWKCTAPSSRQSWIPIDELNLQAQIGYLHSDYREFTASTVIAGKPVVIDRSKETPAVRA